MNSTKAQKVSGACKNPFTHSLNLFAEMTQALNKNIELVRTRFPLEQRDRIRDLLQQFDNNLETVCDLLKQQGAQTEVSPVRLSSIKKMSNQEENRLLKNALLRLNRRYIENKRELDTVRQQNQRLNKQNQTLRLQNCFLREGSYPGFDIRLDDDIC